MKRFPVLAAGAVLVLAAVAAGGYALGHARGADAGKEAGRTAALQGVTPADMALIRQLEGDRAVAAQAAAAGPSPAPASTGGGANCEGHGGDTMAKSSGCRDAMSGDTAPPAPPADAAGAVPAATAYLAWLNAHPQPTEPLLLTRLLAARAALPSDATASGISGSAADDADGEVQVTMHGAMACVIVLAAKVDAGQCYGGAEENTGGGDYGPKRFSPAYQAAE